MKTCLKCGAQFADDAQFCANCGFKDIQFCPECGKSRVPGSLFCAGCGRKYYTAPEGAAEPASQPIPVTEAAPAAPAPVASTPVPTKPSALTASMPTAVCRISR